MNRRARIAFVAFLLAASAAIAAAQDRNKESQLRTVRGTVVDKDENAVASGIVYLKNVKTQTVKTYIADDNGGYRFSGLDPNVDYEIHAEHEDRVSSKRKISSFDSRKEIVIHLKVDKKKEKQEGAKKPAET